MGADAKPARVAGTATDGDPAAELGRQGRPDRAVDAELAREQAYFDAAAAHRDRKRKVLDGATGAAANAGAAAHLRNYANAAAAAGGADQAVAFGRIDPEDGYTFYIGRELVTDDRKKALVVNWRGDPGSPGPAADPGRRPRHRQDRRGPAPGPGCFSITGSGCHRPRCW